MQKSLEKITAFILQHHVMTLATQSNGVVSACSLFYAYDVKSQSFIVASSEDTEHIQNIEKSSQVAGNILLETKSVGKIQGLQLRGEFTLLEKEHLASLYFQDFPYAKLMRPTLWSIRVSSFKFTDNRLGFGKKLLWKRETTS